MNHLRREKRLRQLVRMEELKDLETEIKEILKGEKKVKDRRKEEVSTNGLLQRDECKDVTLPGAIHHLPSSFVAPVTCCNNSGVANLISLKPLAFAIAAELVSLSAFARTINADGASAAAEPVALGLKTKVLVIE